MQELHRQQHHGHTHPAEPLHDKCMDGLVRLLAGSFVVIRKEKLLQIGIGDVVVQRTGERKLDT